MAGQIDLQPQILDLILYAGDGVSFRLICTDKDGAPVDITGTIEAQIRLNRTDDVAPIVEFTPELDISHGGIIILTLTGDQTQLLVDDPSASAGKFTGVWDVQWTADSSEPRTLCQGKVECVLDVTRD